MGKEGHLEDVTHGIPVGYDDDSALFCEDCPGTHRWPEPVPGTEKKKKTEEGDMAASSHGPQRPR